MAVTAIAAIGGLALGAAKFFSANSQAKKDRARLDAMKRPFYKVQDEYFQNRNIAAELATSGLPIDVTNKLSRERAQGLTTNLSALKETAGGPNAFAALNKSFTDSLLNESAISAQQQLKNIEYFMAVNKDLAGQKTTQWGVNELQPYESNLKQTNQRLAADETNKWEGLSEGIGSLSALGTTLSNSNLMGKLFKGDPYPDSKLSNPTDIQPNTDLAKPPDVVGSAPALKPLDIGLNNSFNADVN